MAGSKLRLRHLPPSAVPVTLADLGAGLKTSPNSNENFRLAVANYFGLPIEACYLASSGRTVLYTLLRGLAKENENKRQVVMPAYTCPVVPKVALDLDLEPVFVDICPESTRYQKEPFASALSEKTLAVFLVHPFGIPLPLAEVIEAARRVGAVVIEDAAQAMGARFGGHLAGLSGDFSVFSLGPGKPLSTGGGGIIISNQEENQEALARWWAALPPAREVHSMQAWLRQLVFRMAFHPRGWWAATRVGLQRMGNEAASWGYTVRGLSNAQAEIGRALLPRLDAINGRRREIASTLATAVKKTPAVQLLTVDEEAWPIYLRLPVLVESEERREELFARMWSAGIGAGRLYEKTLPEIFTPRESANFPGAQSFARRLLTLPTHYHITENEIAIMEEILSGF
jgi:dTDP-4-amino-4,6-dideoxygalactose transaminase